MKKILFTSIIFLSLPFFAYATSGACSDDGGVNCGIGPAANGDAICNDGTDSSTSYYTTDECLVNICSAQLASSTYQKYIGSPLSWRQSLQMTISDLLSNLATSSSLDNVAYNGDVASENLSYQEQLQGLQSQEKTAINALANAPDDEISSTTLYYQALINDLNTEHQANLTELASENNAPNAQACTNLWTNVQSEMSAAESYCTSPYNYGPYSTPAAGNLLSCVCKSGYTAVNGKCEGSETACQDTYGRSAYPNADGSCSCPAGTQPDAAQHSCNDVSLSPTPTTVAIPPVVPAPVTQTEMPAPTQVGQIAHVFIQTSPAALGSITTHNAPASLPNTANSTTSVIAATSTATTSPAITPVTPAPRASFLTVLENLIGRLNPFSWF